MKPTKLLRAKRKKLDRANNVLLKAKAAAQRRLDDVTAKLSGAQGKVNGLGRQVAEHSYMAHNYAEWASDAPWYRPDKRAYWYFRSGTEWVVVGTIETAKQTAIKLLDAAKKAVAVAAILKDVGVVSAMSTVTASKGVLSATQFTLGAVKAATSFVTNSLENITKAVNIKSVALKGSLKRLKSGGSVTADVSGVFLSNDFDFTINVAPADAASWGSGIVKIGTSLADKFLKLAENPLELRRILEVSISEEATKRLGSDISNAERKRIIDEVVKNNTPIKEAIAAWKDNPKARRSFINDMFKEVLEREGDQGGLDHYVSLMGRGMTYETVRTHLLMSPEGRPKLIKRVFNKHLLRNPSNGDIKHYSGLMTKGMTADEFDVAIANSDEAITRKYEAQVAGLYMEILGRKADKPGLRHHVDLLKTGSATIDTLRVAFIHGDEHRTQQITKAYESTLGRKPDAGGLAGYLQHIKNGRDISWVSQNLSESGEGIRYQIRLAYKRLLGREAGRAGLKHYFDMVQSGKATMENVEGFLATSEEGRKGAVTGIYKEELGRKPEAAGLKHYISQIAGGRAIEEIRQEIGTSREARVRQITQVYEQELNRKPDSGGLANYVNIVMSGRNTVKGVRGIIRGSQEARSNYIRYLYQSELARAPDPGGFKQWMSHSAQISRDQLLKDFRGGAQAELRGRL